MNAFKKINFRKTLFFALQLVVLGTVAQAPSLINYQGAARYNTGMPIANKIVNIKFDLHQGTSTGSIVASESQTVQTNQFGLFATQIGKNSDLTAVNWQNGGIFLEVA